MPLANRELGEIPCLLGFAWKKILGFLSKMFFSHYISTPAIVHHCFALGTVKIYSQFSTYHIAFHLSADCQSNHSSMIACLFLMDFMYRTTSQLWSHFVFLCQVWLFTGQKLKSVKSAFRPLKPTFGLIAVDLTVALQPTLNIQT